MLLVQILWLALPLVLVGAFHMVAVKRDWFPALRVPVDGGATFRGRRLFGENKTWRGIAILTIGTTLLVWGQALAMARVDALGALALIDFDRVVPGLVGALMGLGYALGELPNSFIKRQMGIAPGVTEAGPAGAFFSLIDQADSVVGCLLLLAVVWRPGWPVFAAALVVCTLLHVAFNAGFHAIGVRKRF